MLVKKIMDKDDPIYAWGSGNQRRSYMHAFDCARLMKEIMDNTVENIVVNIGTKETISISELINKICVISGEKPSIIFDKTKPEGRFIKSSDTTLLEKLTRDKIVSVDLDEGIKRMLIWYEKNFK